MRLTVSTLEFASSKPILFYSKKLKNTLKQSVTLKNEFTVAFKPPTPGALICTRVHIMLSLLFWLY